MKYITQVAYIICLLLFPLTALKASHIVGGEMTYNCLGNNQYEIRLTIFKDCASVSPQTGLNVPFDDPVSIGIFDGQTGQYIRTEFVPLVGSSDTLDLSLNNPCFTVPPNVCIETIVYTKQITLQPNVGGYHLAYQRCCRNDIINNIIAPQFTGATYDVEITPDALANCNSSPRFKEWPPFYICQGTTINYDNSAFDPDGDSIAYELCAPYDGASTGNPAPNIPSAPPYDPVSWSPPYSVNNMLGGSDPLAIDPVTGQLSGTPPATGTFVVGICAKEYRNGVLIGVTKRDFQYSVGYCFPLQAAFVSNIPNCNTSLSSFYLNTSTIQGATYQWDFGDNSPIITADNPVHTFPDTGTYTVQMVATAGSGCVDTVINNVTIQLTGADVTVPLQEACEGDTVLLVAENVLANYNTITSYNWSPAGTILSGQGTDSVYVIASTSPININLSVTNDNNCTEDENTQVIIQYVEANFDSLEFVCNTSLAIPFTNTSTDVSNSFLWDFASIGTSNDVNPTYTFPDTGFYNITLIAGVNGLCQDTTEKQIYIPLDGASILYAGPQEACKGDLVTLGVSNQLIDYNSIVSYSWAPPNLILSGQGTDSVEVLADETTTYSIRVVNENGCVDSILTTLNVLQINALFDSVILICNKSLTVPFYNSSADLGVPFSWDFNGLGTSSDVNPSFTFPDTGSYVVTLIGGIGTLCPDTFSRAVYIPLDGADIEASNAQIVCKGDTVLLTATNLSNYNTIIDYTWTPAANIISGQGTDSVYALATADMSFYVVGLNDENCGDIASSDINITTLTPPLTITASPDSIFVGQVSQLEGTYDVDYVYEWTPDTSLSALNINDPEARPRETTTYYLTVTNQYCSNNDSVTVYIKPPICGDPIIFVPNAFTPDGDGYNDVLMVNGNNISEMTIAIYNRWGQKVFESNDQNIGWDGTYNGKTLPPDVYGYYMQCRCDEGGSLFLKGNITLLR